MKGAAASSFEGAPPALEIRDLTSRYGRVQVLHGIDMNVEQGHIVALVGSNGAGKTTLLRTISGIQPLAGGSIRFFGADLAKVAADRRVRFGICHVPEGRQVFGPMSVEDNLRLGAYARGGGSADDLAEIYDLFDILHEKRHVTAASLSGGQQQMLAIGRALMGKPKLLLLDEPSLGLAPLVADEILRVIGRLRDQGMPILLVEQNAQAALAIADQAFVIETGRIVLQGTGGELLASENVQRAYLGM